MRKSLSYLFCVACAGVTLAGVFSCGGPSHIDNVRRRQPKAYLVLPKENELPELQYEEHKIDTVVVKFDDGQKRILMRAVKDDETGEMVATDVINAAVITARFRNIAERHGKVDLQFQIIVPGEMQDSRWQLRFYPEMTIMEDVTSLDPLLITGVDYRKTQLRGYEQYDRFLSSIVTDPSLFIDFKQLEIFLERHIPEVFAFKTDSTIVSDEVFYSRYGVSERQAVEHYTNHHARRKNNRKIANMDKMYGKYIKAPIVTEGIRLDTVVRNSNGDFVYNYTQTIKTRPKLRKVDIVLYGDIYEQEKLLYEIPRSEPLSFYISTLSSFTDLSDRYLTRVIERKAEANASYSIEFAKGNSDIRMDLADNKEQIAFVKENLSDLLRNEVFDLDSIVVVANASPEGSWEHNGALSRRRGDAVVGYFREFIADYCRKMSREGGFAVDEQGRVVKETAKTPSIRFSSRSVPENWTLLDALVREDNTLTEEQKAKYMSYSDVRNMDVRESRMKQDDYYGYVSEQLYPKLRVVDFAFHLHRKGMVKDTVHTTELDREYMKGVQMLRDMDYENAVKVLGPYQDYNAAVAYMAAERNASALLILQNLPKSAKVNYLLAILYSRSGNTQKALQAYLEACREDETFVHRGNLDPEISVLIKRYGLNRRDSGDDIDVDL